MKTTSKQNKIENNHLINNTKKAKIIVLTSFLGLGTFVVCCSIFGI